MRECHFIEFSSSPLQGEIKLPVILEDGNEIPNIYSFYKPIRQMVYAIVFNLHHHRYMANKENRRKCFRTWSVRYKYVEGVRT